MLKNNNLRLLSVFLIALVLRGIRPGLYIVHLDELVTFNAVADLVKQGEWTWIGNPSTWKLLPYHSPLPNYILSIPFWLTGNPIYLRLFIAILSALCSVIAMKMLTRYSNPRTALIAGLLIAVMPQSVEWGRFVWNPNLAPTFILLWIYTLILGYKNNKRGVQILHWLSLSICFQTQAALLMLIPTSVLAMMIWHWRHHHWRDFATSSIAIVLTILSCLPWMIGIATFRYDIQPVDLNLHLPDWTFAAKYYAELIASVDFRFYRIYLGETWYWWFPDYRISLAFHVHLICTGIGIVHSLKTRAYEHVVWLIILIVPLGFFVLPHQEVAHHYLMPALYAACIVTALGFNVIIETYRRIGIVIFSMIFLAQLWLTIAHLGWFAWESRAEYSHLSHLDTMHQQVEDWHQEAPIIFIEGENDEYFERLEWTMFWKFYEKMGWARQVQFGAGIPLDPAATIIVERVNDPSIAHYFGRSEIVENLPALQVLQLHSDMLPALHFVPASDDSFFGLMNVRGAFLLEDQIILYWTAFQTSPVEIYQFSIEVTYTNGESDVSTVLSLPSYQWRYGEQVLTRIPLDIVDVEFIMIELSRESDEQLSRVGLGESTQMRLIPLSPP
jgi:4-amino-4-deoxy-L-arabinose transferase-like glycosyltransferase